MADVTVNAAPRTIRLKGLGSRYEDIATGAITPGMLLKFSSSGLTAQSQASGKVPQLFALENELIGLGIDDAYAANDFVQAEFMYPGMWVNALLAANALPINKGDLLESAGDGTVRRTGSAASGDGLYIAGALAISATATDFKTTATAYFKVAGVQYTKAATDTLTFSSAYTVNAAAAAPLVFGAFLVQINAAGTISTLAPAADQSYASAALALDAAEQITPTAGSIRLGYITIGSKASSTWTANTSNMTPTNGCQTSAFADAPIEAADPVSAVAASLDTVDNSQSSSTARCRVVLI